MKLHRLLSLFVLVIVVLTVAAPKAPVSAQTPGNNPFCYPTGVRIQDGIYCDQNPPHVTINKTAVDNDVNRGESAVFKVKIKNEELSRYVDVIVKDELPDAHGLSWTVDAASSEDCAITDQELTCDYDHLAPGASRTVTLTSPTDEVSCGDISNTALYYPKTASGSIPQNYTVIQNNSTAVIHVNCPTKLPHLTVTKTTDTSPVELGGTLGYQITIANSGPGAASNVVVEDQLTAGLSWTVTGSSGCSINSTNRLVCNLDDLASGGSVTIHVTAQTTEAACGDLTNTATARADNNEQVSSEEVIVNVHCPTPLAVNVRVTKSALVSPINPGEVASFMITVTNDGPGAATDVKLNDALPTITGLSWSIVTPVAGCSIAANALTCTFASMAAAESRSVTVTSSTVGIVCGNISNTATVTAGNETTGNQGDNSASADVAMNCSNLTVTKTADARSVRASEPVGFTITVTNNGQAVATSVVLDDSLDSRLTWSVTSGTGCAITVSSSGAPLLTCHFGDLAIGASASVHVTARSTPAVCGDLTNTAFAEAANFARVPSNDAVVTITCTSGVNVAVTKTAEKPTLYAGEPANFFITVSNDSTGTVTGVTLTDTLPTAAGLTWSIASPAPAGCSLAANVVTCSFGSMAPGDSFTLIVTSPTFDFGGGNITNTATVAATNETPGNQGDNTATAQTTVLAQACLSLDIFNGKYINDFESSTQNKIGINNFRRSQAPKGQSFLGDYSDESAALTVACLPDGTNTLLVSFDLYIIRSWDGNITVSPYGPDHWKAEVDGGPVLLDTSFTNWPNHTQAFPDNFGANHPERTGAVAVNVLGYQFFGLSLDTVYHLAFAVPVQGTVLTLKFTGYGLEDIINESWGIDNLQVVPLGNINYYLPIVNK